MPSPTATRPWLHWYGTARWLKIARNQLRKEPLCAMCLAENTITVATVADHIKPHKGDSVLFWFGKLQSLCAPHHSGQKQKLEYLGYSTDIGLDGWPKDKAHPAYSKGE